MSRKPLIGMSPRFAKGKDDEFGNHISDDESTAKVFADSILAAGGLPVCLPLTSDEALLDQMVAELDGFAVPGGPDVDPAYWGVEGYDEALLCHERDAFEYPLLKRALAANKPIFTTCRGTQLLNVVLGGTLCMDVPNLERLGGATPVNHSHCLSMLCHKVEVYDNTLLAQSLGQSGEIEVNSYHHCCLDKLGDGLVVSARSCDGIIECVELPQNTFVVGVQWHPEYTWQMCDYDFNLWKAFVAACSN